MTWQTTLTINNNTAYNITVTHNNIGDLTTIEPNSSWSNTDQESTPNNTNALKFWQQPNVWFMQGSVSFGPTAGVYVDRGWMDPNAQTIKMTANANGKVWVQTQNGGETLLAWNEFEQGGTITLTFDPE
jgi:hypothetical protein